jgi:hypothetical protein
MKSNQGPKGSVLQPLLKKVVDLAKGKSNVEKPSVGSKPLDPPALYQDAGLGYNSDFTFPQR